MCQSIQNFNTPLPLGISRKFEFKFSPGSREFDAVGYLIRVGNLNKKNFAHFHVLPACPG
jgi:hypothetical protein